MSTYILAHDLGTSGNKATLFDEEGTMIASCVSSYSTAFMSGNRAEQDALHWWHAVCDSSQQVLTHIDRKDVSAVSFSGQMMACLGVDAQGDPLHKAMIYCDLRSEVQARRLADAIGTERLYEITGNRPSAAYTLEKVMWLKEHEPQIYRRIHKVLQAKDYVSYRLTGEYATDYNDASGTQAFDLKALCWSPEIFEAAGVDPELFPRAVPSTTVVGYVHRNASIDTGIPEGVPVVIGAGDGGCATLGAGSVSEGKPYCCMGSTAWVSVTSSEPVLDPAMRVFTFAHPIEGLYHPCGTMQSAGSAFTWFANVMKGNAEAATFDDLNDQAAFSSPGAGGVLFLPYLMGERSPWWNTRAKAEFLGMHMNTSFEDLCRAVIEGVAMNLKLSLDIMTDQLKDPSIMLIGGGARGAIWQEVFADIFGKALTVPRLLTEATSMGAALLAGVGTGIYPDFSMVEQMNPVSETVTPHAELRPLYERQQRLFSMAYTSLTDLFDAMDTP